jgi:predicted Zn-dependent protease
VRLALGFGLVALAAAIVTFVKGVPLLAAYVAERIPVSWEEQLGEQVVGRLTAGSEVCGDSLVDVSLTGIVARLAEAAPSPYEWNVRVVQQDAVNAFATPGGYIVVFSGLLEQAARPEQVAGVLAHEMQHVLNRHGTESLLRHVPLRLLLGAFTGDAAAWGGAVESLANVGMLRYQQRDEEEADRKGVALLQAAQIDARGLVEFFEILEDEDTDVPGLLSYLSTHPNTRARIEAIEELIASGEADPPRALLPGVDWEAARGACKTDR